MSERVVGGLDARGRAVVRKRAGGPAARRLGWEVRALTTARHPGVVELLDHRPDELVLAYAGTHSLGSVPPLPLDRIAAVGARMAATASDLHALGLVHGRIDPTHVLLGTDDAPILCGFSGATIGGEVGPPTSPPAAGFGDPRVVSGAPAPPSADVYGIGALLGFLLDRGGGRLRPPAGRRRFLLSVARAATALEPHRRPTASELAARLGRPHRSRSGAVVTAAALVGVLTAAVTIPAMTPSGDRSEVIRSAVAPGVHKAAGVPPPPLQPVPATPVIVAPNVVAVGSDRFQAGAPGDQVLLGDWDCDGRPTVGLLRPSSGAVFLFDAWASAGRQLRATAVKVVAGSVRATAVDLDGDGCHRVLVERAGGDPVEVGR